MSNAMIKDIRVKTLNGVRLTKVLVLRETDKGIVYIPLNGIDRQDYDRFLDIGSRADGDLLEALRDERLNNGRNALVVYQDILRHQAYEQETTQSITPEKAQAAPRRRPGPKPGTKRSPTAKKSGPKPKPKPPVDDSASDENE